MLKTVSTFIFCLLTFTVNGQTLDASFFPDYIGGLVLANDLSSPNTMLDVSSGSAVDSAAAAWIKTPMLRKSTTCAWISGSGNCGMALGLTVLPNAWYSVFAIVNGGIGDVYFDIPALDATNNQTITNPPSGTTSWRHIGWFMTDASSNIIGMLCDGNDDCFWKNCQCDMVAGHYDYLQVNPCNTPTAVSGNTPTCYTTFKPAHIPPGKVTATLRLDIANISIPQSAARWIIMDPDLPSGSDSAGVLNGLGVCDTEPQLPITIECQVQVKTDSLGQIKMQMNSNPAGSGQNGTAYLVDSKGWHYTRKRNALPPSPPPGTIGTPTVVGTLGTSPGTYSSVGLTTTATITTGNMIGVCIGMNTTNTVTVSSVSDGINTYTKANQQTVSPNTDIELWYAANVVGVGSGATLTINLSGSTGASSGVSVVAAQDTGIASVPLDQIVGASSGSGTSLSASTGTLAQSSELVLGCSFQVPTSTYFGASGFTNSSRVAAPSGNGTAWLDYEVVSSTSPVTYNPSWTSTGRIGAIVGTFK